MPAGGAPGGGGSRRERRADETEKERRVKEKIHLYAPALHFLISVVRKKGVSDNYARADVLVSRDTPIGKLVRFVFCFWIFFEGIWIFYVGRDWEIYRLKFAKDVFIFNWKNVWYESRI